MPARLDTTVAVKPPRQGLPRAWLLVLIMLAVCALCYYWFTHRLLSGSPIPIRSVSAPPHTESQSAGSAAHATDPTAAAPASRPAPDPFPVLGWSNDTRTWSTHFGLTVILGTPSRYMEIRPGNRDPLGRLWGLTRFNALFYRDATGDHEWHPDSQDFSVAHSPAPAQSGPVPLVAPPAR